MDAWIGAIGTLLGAVVGGGVAYLNGTRGRKLEASSERERCVTDVAGELLQIADARERYVHGYLEALRSSRAAAPRTARRTPPGRSS